MADSLDSEIAEVFCTEQQVTPVTISDWVRFLEPSVARVVSHLRSHPVALPMKTLLQSTVALVCSNSCI